MNSETDDKMSEKKTSGEPTMGEEPTSAPEGAGLVLVFEESQDGSKNHEGEEEALKSRGKLIVKNQTGGPIYDFELILNDTENTDLRDKIEEGYLQHSDDSSKVVEYTVTDQNFMCEFSEELDFKEGLMTPVAVYKRETPLALQFSLQNNTRGPLSVKLSRELPEKMQIPQLPSVGKGELSKNGELGWKISSLTPDEQVEASIDANILSKDAEEFRSGVTKYKSKGEGFTLSGVEVDAVRAGVVETVAETTRKEERVEERRIWDASIEVENDSDAPVTAIGKFGVMSGEIIGGGEEEEGGETIPGRVESPIPGKREYPQIVSDPVQVPPGEEKIIGPFPIRSEEEPRLTFDTEYEITPEIVKRVSGTHEVKDIVIPCLNAELDKEATVDHPPAASGLSSDELMSNLEEPVKITMETENTGSAHIDYCEVYESIPEGFSPPSRSNISVLLNIGEMGEMDVPEDNVNVSINPEDPMEENEVKITVKNISHVFESPMEQEDYLFVEYETKALNPEAGKKYKLPSSNHVALTSADRPTKFELEEVPVLTTAEIKREVKKRKQIAPGSGENEFVVTAVLRNEGNLPAKDYEFSDLIPSSFELIEGSGEPQPDRKLEVPNGLEVRWTLEEIPPEGKETVEYTVRGIRDFRVSELKKVRD